MKSDKIECEMCAHKGDDAVCERCSECDLWKNPDDDSMDDDLSYWDFFDSQEE